jgi:hypothetical protein
MTRDELLGILVELVLMQNFDNAIPLIWGQPFDGETEKINTAKSVSLTSPAAEDSSATLSESFPDGTTYTRSYQVFLPNPTPTQPQ